MPSSADIPLVPWMTVKPDDAALQFFVPATSSICGITSMTDFEDRPPPAVGAYWVKEEDYPALPKLSGDGKHRSARRSRLAGSLRHLLRDGGQPHRRGEIVVVFPMGSFAVGIGDPNVTWIGGRCAVLQDPS